MSRPTCKTCRFLDDAGYNGYCHRRAPDVDRRWPLMSYGDWCGEHEPKPEPDGEAYLMPPKQTKTFVAKILNRGRGKPLLHY